MIKPSRFSWALALVLALPLLQPEPAQALDLEPPDHSGIVAAFDLAQYFFNNGAPLAYGLSLGYEFTRGLRLDSGIDTFYYAGEEEGARYSYQANDWTIQALYSFPLRGLLLAQAGANLEFLFGTRQFENVTGARPDAFSGGIGLSPELGLALEWTPRSQAALRGRWVHTFGSPVPFPAASLSVSTLW
jgi:hypothetical protein